MTKKELLKELISEADNLVFTYSANYGMTKPKEGCEDKWRLAVEKSDLLRQMLKWAEDMEECREGIKKALNSPFVPDDNDESDICEQYCGICPHRICGKKQGEQSILNESYVKKITVKNMKTGKETAVITADTITTADSDIVVVLTPKYD